MPLPICRSPVAAALALSAFGALFAAAPTFAQTQAFSAQGGDVPIYGPSPEPVVVPGSKPLAISTIDALRDQGIYYFNGPRVTQLRVGGAATGQSWPLVETTTDPTTAAVANNLDAAHFVLNGERRAVGKPSSVSAAERGGNSRVGLEDNIYISKGVLAKGNWELVAEAAKRAKAKGRELATPQQARELLRLT